jgi:hypothetical protein
MRLNPSMHKHTDRSSYKYLSLVFSLRLVWPDEESFLSCDVALVTRASVISEARIGP